MAKLLIGNDLHSPMRIYVPLLENTLSSAMPTQSRQEMER